MPKAKTNLKLSEQDTVRLLQLYQSETCLYDVHNDGYRNHDVRAVAVRRIAEALNVQGFGPKEVVTKFKNLRNSYSQELKKINDASMNDVYVTKVYWFEIMDSFLRPYIYMRPTQLNHVISENNENEDPGGSCFLEQIVKTEDVNPDVPYNIISALPVIERKEISRKLCTGDMDNAGREVAPESFITIASEHGRNNTRKRKCTPSSLNLSRSDDMFDYYGKYVASLLRTLGNPKAIMIQQEIATVILKHMCDDTNH